MTNPPPPSAAALRERVAEIRYEAAQCASGEPLGAAWIAIRNLCDVQRDTLALIPHAVGEEPKGTEETGWLVEQTATPPKWWAGGLMWSTDANAAIRFARQRDAEMVIVRLTAARFYTLRATEHAWLDVAGSGAEQVGQSKLSERNADTRDASLLQQATVPPSALSEESGAGNLLGSVQYVAGGVAYKPPPLPTSPPSVSQPPRFEPQTGEDWFHEAHRLRDEIASLRARLREGEQKP